MHVYLHIGPHKTGTSAIQSALSRNQEGLLSRGLWYKPDLDSTNQSPTAQLFRFRHPLAREHLEKQLQSALAAGASKFLISSEDFCDPPIAMDLLADTLSGFQCTVIAYLRRGDDLVLAAHNQLVRTESSRWTTRPTERLAYDPSSWDVLSPWMNWNLVLAPYDRAQWPDGNITADLLAMTGTEFQDLDLNGTENQSLPPALIEVLRIANKTSLAGEEREAFIAELYDTWKRYPEMYSSGSLISEQERKEYRDHMSRAMILYQPKLRDGFDVSYLMIDS